MLLFRLYPEVGDLRTKVPDKRTFGAQVLKSGHYTQNPSWGI
jgi:hypothetical protein